MSLSGSQLITGLGTGQSLREIAQSAGVSEPEAHAIWQALVRARLPPASAVLDGAVASSTEIIRDSYGVPHVYAQTERDVFFGLGFAMAQDRLWQMDYLRRKATGRLAELLGDGSVEQDYLYRILDFRLVCSRNYDRLADRWRQVVDGMADGINRAMTQAESNLPIEFDLLGYQPEPWSPVDILIGLRYQWWGLSGRLPGITSATILERELGDRLEAFQRLERDDLYIVPDGLNAAVVSGDPVPVRDSLYVGDQPHGSNNWVIGGMRTSSGKPLLANDPHYGYAHAHGQFYCCHLNGAGHSEAGFVFVGTPGMMSGANDRIAWGFTNNGTTDGVIASANQRTVNPSYPWPLYGSYAGGTRQARILQVLRARTDHDAADFRRMQYDSKSLIAEEVMPRLLAALATSDEPRVKHAADLLASWDYRATVQTPVPAIFQTFMHRWTSAYAAATLPDQAEVRAAAGPAARRALVGEEDTLSSNVLDALVVATLLASLDELAARLGDDPAGWTWGRVHYYAWPHPLGKIGHLGELLNGPTFPCAGTDNTIDNVSPSASEPFVASSGPVYRLIADLANPSAIYVNSHCPTSANPASPHFVDTIRDWANGNYQTLYRARALIEREAEGTTVIHPLVK